MHIIVHVYITYIWCYIVPCVYNIHEVHTYVGPCTRHMYVVHVCIMVPSNIKQEAVLLLLLLNSTTTRVNTCTVYTCTKIKNYNVNLKKDF